MQPVPKTRLMHRHSDASYWQSSADVY